jgi:hypothetical protein
MDPEVDSSRTFLWGHGGTFCSGPAGSFHPGDLDDRPEVTDEPSPRVVLSVVRGPHPQARLLWAGQAFR